MENKYQRRKINVLNTKKTVYPFKLIFLVVINKIAIHSIHFNLEF